MRAEHTPHVLLDATALPASRGGVGRYVDGLVPALINAGVDLSVVSQPGDLANFEQAGAHVFPAPRLTSSTAGRLLWEQFGLPLLARRIGADVIHSVHYTFPLATRLPHVVTVHDLTFFTHPELHTAVKRRFFRFWIRATKRARATIVTPSRATADEYVRLTGANGDRVVVARLGFDAELFSPPSTISIDALRADLGTGDRGWIAFLGTLEPRKNVVALIDGYLQAVHDAERKAPPLLLAGGPGWDDEVDPALRRAAAAGADVRALGYLPLEQLSAFLGGSTIVAYPSLGEGFGLPVLEAMATGACVLTTRELSLPEVGGDAVDYTGTSAVEIGRRLASLLADPDRRAELGSRALIRAREFTWTNSAIAHVGAYDRAAANT
ncbi:MAG: glycosyltransferase family 1 protein [Herbiconiux sp.]|uniref:glycosyltransferase family 4 protein n=1 Tax=Herbiconiux sp. TaxID=1871186 RepID=UPI00121F382A|nr:glycosyltransferase family 1 protein [Herbiconiux sp.]TAJ49313.1 MAG: glycosyltransferase family 1 protein [Herbiconiux sp.]